MGGVREDARGVRAVRTGAVIMQSWPDLTVDRHVRLAGLCEEAGYDLVLFPEAFGVEGFALCAAVAAATSRIQVGNGILPIANRSAALTAMGAATVADASGGRFVLGLGAGHRAITTGWHEQPDFEPRIGRVRDYLLAVRRILSGHVNERGYGLSLRGPDRLPIHLAALRPAALRLAGELADGAQLLLIPLDDVARTAALVREGAERVGRDPAEVDVCFALMACVTDDPGPARETARRTLAWYGGLPFYNAMFADGGFPDEAAAMARAWERLTASAGGRDAIMLPVDDVLEHVPDALIDAIFAIGSAPECRSRLAALRSRGIDRATVYPFGPYADGAAAEVGFARTLVELAGA